MEVELKKVEALKEEYERKNLEQVGHTQTHTDTINIHTVKHTHTLYEHCVLVCRASRSSSSAVRPLPSRGSCSDRHSARRGS